MKLLALVGIGVLLAYIADRRAAARDETIELLRRVKGTP